MFTYFFVQSNRLMSALTSLGTGSSLAIAHRLLSWVDRADYFALQNLRSWQLDGTSFFLGLLSGLLLFLAIECWFTVKLVLIRWSERGSPREQGPRPRALGKPLYKLC